MPLGLLATSLGLGSEMAWIADVTPCARVATTSEEGAACSITAGIAGGENAAATSEEAVSWLRTPEHLLGASAAAISLETPRDPSVHPRAAAASEEAAGRVCTADFLEPACFEVASVEAVA